MTLKDRIISYVRHGDIVRRAIDPATGEPFPQAESPPLSLRAAAMLAKTPWAWRQMMKVAYTATAALSAWLVKAGANEDHKTAIVTGALAAAAFAFEHLISWLCAKAKVDPPKFAAAASLEGPASFAEATSAFKRPSIFTTKDSAITPRQIEARALVGIQGNQQPETTPAIVHPALETMPQEKQKRPIGEKGQKIIAEYMAGEQQPQEIRGTLRGECDGLVIIDTDDGAKALYEADYDFYIQALR